MIDAVAKTAAAGRLVVDAHGIYCQVFDVAGYLVTITGRVVDGVPRISDAWVERWRR
jgi:hypothetical protein